MCSDKLPALSSRSHTQEEPLRLIIDRMNEILRELKQRKPCLLCGGFTFSEAAALVVRAPRGGEAMTDPKFPVGAHVLLNGRAALVERHGFAFDEQLIYRFLGYHLTFPDGSFSGWHPEAEIRKDDSA